MEEIFKFADKLNSSYINFRENLLNDRRFKHADILELIGVKRANSLFQISLAGHSVENREIFLIKTGKGRQKIFLWSQMHGDEPTATAAIFDILNFLAQQQDFQAEIRAILENLDLYFLPMVNPDGAEVYKRRNALDIDLNRDAARLEAKETRLLKSLRDQINPEYGFNLHDQEIYYAAGSAPFPATISFLAPSFNIEKEIDEKRLKSIAQIVLMNKVLQKFIPNCIGRYNDDFMPAAFGDNMQLWGTSTILIESGGYYSDPEKQTARKMNFICILSSLYSLALKNEDTFDKKEYFNIPENKKDKFFDLIIRNAMMERNGHVYKIDVGIRNKEICSADFRTYNRRAVISDIGDLSYSYAYDEIEAHGLYIKKTNPNHSENLLIEDNADFWLVKESGEKVYKIENGELKK